MKKKLLWAEGNAEYNVWVSGKVVDTVEAETWALALAEAVERFGNRAWVSVKEIK